MDEARGRNLSLALSISLTPMTSLHLVTLTGIGKFVGN